MDIEELGTGADTDGYDRGLMAAGYVHISYLSWAFNLQAVLR